MAEQQTRYTVPPPIWFKNGVDLEQIQRRLEPVGQLRAEADEIRADAKRGQLRPDRDECSRLFLTLWHERHLLPPLLRELIPGTGGGPVHPSDASSLVEGEADCWCRIAEHLAAGFPSRFDQRVAGALTQDCRRAVIEANHVPPCGALDWGRAMATVCEVIADQIDGGLSEFEQTPAAADSNMKPAVPALTGNHIDILKALRKIGPGRLATLDMITECALISVRTAGPVVIELISMGLARRPNGDRGGTQITADGLRRLVKIAD